MYKIALVVPKITNDIHRNKRKILSFYKCYGGANVFNSNGEIIKSMPIMREGILYFDL